MLALASKIKKHLFRKGAYKINASIWMQGCIFVVSWKKKKLYSQADNAEWARDFFARQGELTQEYLVYFKEGQRSLAEKSVQAALDVL